MTEENKSDSQQESVTKTSEVVNIPVEKELPEDIISKKDKFDLWIKAATLIFTLTAVGITLATYLLTQKWKTAEFTYSTFKQFSENKSVIIANKILDYNRARVILDGDSATYIEKDFVSYSLRIDTIDGDFVYPQGKIRDVFDEYLDQLSLFNRYAKSNLISYEKIKPYLQYQLEIIADEQNPRTDENFRQALIDYIDYYNFTDVKELCKNLGYDIDKK